MSEYTDVMAANDLASGAMVELEVGESTLLVAHVGDAYLATQGRCPHLGGHLARGQLEGSIVTCPRHGSQFDLTDGRVIRWTDWTGVAETLAEVLKHPRPLVTYEVRVEEGRILVGPEKSAPTAID